MSYRRRRQQTMVSEILEELDRRRADVGRSIYSGPQGRRGQHRVTKPGSGSTERVISGSGGRTYAPGTAVPVAHAQGSARETIISEPPPGDAGTGALPPDSRSGAIDAVKIVSCDPATVGSGESTAVTLAGAGFRPQPVDTVRAVVLDEGVGGVVADPLVTVSVVSWVDAETLTATIAVDATAPPGYPVHLEVTRS